MYHQENGKNLLSLFVPKGQRQAHAYEEILIESKILTILNLWYAASRNWTCAEPRLCWMKLCSSDNQVPQY